MMTVPFPEGNFPEPREHGGFQSPGLRQRSRRFPGADQIGGIDGVQGHPGCPGHQGRRLFPARIIQGIVAPALEDALPVGQGLPMAHQIDCFHKNILYPDPVRPGEQPEYKTGLSCDSPPPFVVCYALAI